MSTPWDVKMSYKILDSVEGIATGGFLGNTHTYEVVGVIGDSVRFEHSNTTTFSVAPKTVTITLTAAGSESTVLLHSWQHVRAIVVSGTPSYFVSSSKV